MKQALCLQKGFKIDARAGLNILSNHRQSVSRTVVDGGTQKCEKSN